MTRFRRFRESTQDIREQYECVSEVLKISVVNILRLLSICLRFINERRRSFLSLNVNYFGEHQLKVQYLNGIHIVGGILLEEIFPRVQ